MKTCTKCRTEKPFEQFSKARATRDGRQRWCKECMSAALAARRAANPGIDRDAKREWHFANHDARLKTLKDWRDANKEHRRQSFIDWRKANPGVVNARNARRRAQRSQATPPWVNPDDFLHIYQIATDASALSGVKYHVDHIVPLKGDDVCGLHVPWNLRVIPASENLSKGAKFIEELACA